MDICYCNDCTEVLLNVIDTLELNANSFCAKNKLKLFLNMVNVSMQSGPNCICVAENNCNLQNYDYKDLFIIQAGPRHMAQAFFGKVYDFFEILFV